MTALDTASLPPLRSGRQLLALWFGVLGPPVLWLIHLQVNYITVPLACRRDAPVIVHGVTVAAIMMVAATGLLALRNWRHAGREWPDSSAGIVSQDRFLAAVGLLCSALIIMALVAQWLPTFFLDPCR
jgi:hypothetical protein